MQTVDDREADADSLREAIMQVLHTKKVVKKKFFWIKNLIISHELNRFNILCNVSLTLNVNDFVYLP